MRGMGAQGEGGSRDRALCPQAGSRKGEGMELWLRMAAGEVPRAMG